MQKTVKSNQALLKSMWDCYRKKGGWENGSILPSHERESTQSYARRKKSFYAPGLYTYFINTFDCLWAKEPVRKNYTDLYKQFIWDAGYSMSLNQVLKRGLKTATSLGSAFLIMDTDADQSDNYEDMLDERKFPFLEIVLPQQVQQIVVDRLGRLIKFSYGYYAFDDENKTVLNYREYTPGKVTIYDNKHTVTSTVETIEGTIPVIPIIPTREPLETSDLPSSPTLNLYQGELDITVNKSLINQQSYAQQFSILVINKDMTPIPEGQVQIGVSDVMILGQQDKATFITPASSPIDQMLKNIDSDVLMMTKTFANLLTSGEAQSGVAKIIDRQVGSLALKDLSIYMQEIEYKVYELFCAFTNTTPSIEFDVEYNKDFDMTEIKSYIEDATKLLALELSDETKSQIRQDIVKSFFSGKDPDTLQKIIESEQNNLSYAEKSTILYNDEPSSELSNIDDENIEEQNGK